MKLYHRPIILSEPTRDALSLAGGPCWFREVAIFERNMPSFIAPASDLPADILTRLTAPRAPVAGLNMDRPRIMGILNVTPDSFSDGGDHAGLDSAMAHARRMQVDGAEIIDIGGESTRPGAVTVPDSEEISRTSPVIAAIRAQSDIAISIDTRKAAVAQAAITAGASMVNDVAAFSYDPALAQVTAQSGLPVCLMHAQGDPATMQDNPVYEDVLADVYDFLESSVQQAEAAGIARDRIIVDPGIGFGKTEAHNLILLRHLALFHSLGCPILLGASRKRFIGTIGGGDHAKDRMAGSVAVALHAATQGVQILRVHDTFQTKQALALQAAIKGTEIR
ncbi:MULTISPECIES: dihydropteroate synthase [unclassified Yoonia]|uniref:dihydropteroate synthase n=1 Tax=unclassified Yoonia TaxID=2629118 RepID=UPI002AFF149A|nr:MULTISPECIES: dihydropteroate synthase [unclassified Yoonia]